MKAEAEKRKIVEASLMESEARLHALIDNLPLKFWSADKELCYCIQNTISLNNYGNLLGMKLRELDIPESVKSSWIEQDIDLKNKMEKKLIEEEKRYRNLLPPSIFFFIIWHLVFYVNKPK